jgi:hypothetical protein
VALRSAATASLIAVRTSGYFSKSTDKRLRFGGSFLLDFVACFAAIEESLCDRHIKRQEKSLKKFQIADLVKAG